MAKGRKAKNKDLPNPEREIRTSSANGIVALRTSATQITLPIRVPTPTCFMYLCS